MCRAALSGISTVTSIDLDDPGTFSRLDPDDMFRRVNDLPHQIEDAWRIAQSVRVPDHIDKQATW